MTKQDLKTSEMIHYRGANLSEQQTAGLLLYSEKFLMVQIFTNWPLEEIFVF